MSNDNILLQCADKIKVYPHISNNPIFSPVSAYEHTVYA